MLNAPTVDSGSAVRDECLRVGILQITWFDPFPTLLEEGLVGQVSISFLVAVCPDYDYFIVPPPKISPHQSGLFRLDSILIFRGPARPVALRLTLLRPPLFTCRRL